MQQHQLPRRSNQQLRPDKSAGKDKDGDTIIMSDSGDIIWKEEGKGGKKGGDTIVMKGRRKREILLPVIRANQDDQ
uniref:Uncharacterized protein n=1 Tax=Tetranychus urticae TaxID=32264 RepID=T1KIC7_TETUR